MLKKGEDELMPIRKVKDEIYILENALLCELGYYVLENHPDIVSKFKEYHKEKMK